MVTTYVSICYLISDGQTGNDVTISTSLAASADLSDDGSFLDRP